MRVISLAADGIESADQQGFFDWVTQQDADIICVQDLRQWEYRLQHDILEPEGYHGYFFDAAEEHTNGVAIYCRRPPKAIMTGLGFMPADQEGRYIQADYDEISIGSLLAPSGLKNGQNDADAQAHKDQFYDQLQAHLNKVSRKRREYVICGNWNLCTDDRDLAAPEQHRNSSGNLPSERQWMDQLIYQLGYSDAFRQANRDPDEYTWLPTEPINGADPDQGWRTDLQIVSAGIQPLVEHAAIYKSQRFSSHSPVIVDYDYEL